MKMRMTNVISQKRPKRFRQLQSFSVKLLYNCNLRSVRNDLKSIPAFKKDEQAFLSSIEKHCTQTLCTGRGLCLGTHIARINMSQLYVKSSSNCMNDNRLLAAAPGDRHAQLIRRFQLHVKSVMCQN